MTAISEIGGDDFNYSPSQEKELNPTDSKTKLFVLSLLALCATGAYTYQKRKASLSTQIAPVQDFVPFLDVNLPSEKSPPASPSAERSDSPAHQTEIERNDSPVSQSEDDPDSSEPSTVLEMDLEDRPLTGSRESSNQEEGLSSLSSSTSETSPREESQNRPTLHPLPASPHPATSSNAFARSSLPSPNQIQKTLDGKIQKNIATVREILKTIEATPLLDLRKKQQELQNMGETIASLHPFNFLAYAPHVEMRAILTSKNLPKNMLVFGEIIGGLKRSMEAADNNNQLIDYIDLFIQDFQIDYDLSMPCPGTSSNFLLNKKTTPEKNSSLISGLIKERKWEVLLKYLFVPGEVKQIKSFFGKLEWEFIPS